MRNGYTLWRETGKKLFGKETPNLDLEGMGLTELGERKLRGEDWLKEHEEHPSYEEQLKRYEAIVDRISLLEKQEAISNPYGS